MFPPKPIQPPVLASDISRKALQDVVDTAIFNALREQGIELTVDNKRRMVRVCMHLGARVAQTFAYDPDTFGQHATQIFRQEMPTTRLEALAKGSLYVPKIGIA